MTTIQTGRPIPALRLRDLASLVGSYSAAFFRRPFDAGAVLRAWMDGMTAAHGSDHLMVNLLGKRLLLVNERTFSDCVLNAEPATGSFGPGAMKSEAMAFLAPEALTTAEGPSWRRLRDFNEHALCSGETHGHAQVFLEHVRKAFSTRMSGIDDIRRAMGWVMLGVVFGSRSVPDRIVDDIQVLFGVVQNPLKRKVFGFAYRRRLNRFYAAVRAAMAQRSVSPSLLAAGSPNGAVGEDTAAQQIPHWMFTFTGSGTDLLARTLAMIQARPDVLARVCAEIEAAGRIDNAATIVGLQYVEACLLETGRLFPPVQRTFHRATQETTIDGYRIPEGTEIVHLFSLLQRRPDERPEEEEFRPEHWLGDRAQEPYSNLFLRGPRTCPGRDLILFVCKCAIAQQIGSFGLRATRSALSDDPLPISFPRKALRYES